MPLRTLVSHSSFEEERNRLIAVRQQDVDFYNLPGTFFFRFGPGLIMPRIWEYWKSLEKDMCQHWSFIFKFQLYLLSLISVVCWFAPCVRLSGLVQGF